MQKIITEFMRCNQCIHHNVCKYAKSEDKVTIPEGYPVEVKVNCKEFKEQEIFIPR